MDPAIAETPVLLTMVGPMEAMDKARPPAWGEMRAGLCNHKVILSRQQGLSGQGARQVVFSTMWIWNTSKLGLSLL